MSGSSMTHRSNLQAFLNLASEIVMRKIETDPEVRKLGVGGFVACVDAVTTTGRERRVEGETGMYLVNYKIWNQARSNLKMIDENQLQPTNFHSLYTDQSDRPRLSAPIVFPRVIRIPASALLGGGSSSPAQTQTEMWTVLPTKNLADVDCFFPLEISRVDDALQARRHSQSKHPAQSEDSQTAREVQQAGTVSAELTVETPDIIVWQFAGSLNALVKTDTFYRTDDPQSKLIFVSSEKAQAKAEFYIKWLMSELQAGHQLEDLSQMIESSVE